MRPNLPRPRLEDHSAELAVLRLGEACSDEHVLIKRQPRVHNLLSYCGVHFGSVVMHADRGMGNQRRYRTTGTLGAFTVVHGAAADIAARNGDRAAARVYRGVADDFQRSVKGWTVTSNGPASPDPYFIRLSKTGDPNADIDYNVGNGGPTLDQREVIDAGFLELPRLGMLPADDPDVLRSLRVVDDAIRVETGSGPGWPRYNGDGYGEHADGSPYDGVLMNYVNPVTGGPVNRGTSLEHEVCPPSRLTPLRRDTSVMVRRSSA